MVAQQAKAGAWVPVVYAIDLPACDLCEEPWCPTHSAHYDDCACVGPCQAEEYEYAEIDGIEFARKLPEVNKSAA